MILPGQSRPVLPTFEHIGSKKYKSFPGALHSLTGKSRLTGSLWGGSQITVRAAQSSPPLPWCSSLRRHMTTQVSWPTHQKEREMKAVTGSLLFSLHAAGTIQLKL